MIDFLLSLPFLMFGLLNPPEGQKVQNCCSQHLGLQSLKTKMLLLGQQVVKYSTILHPLLLVTAPLFATLIV
jgi:hypothetical protein